MSKYSDKKRRQAEAAIDRDIILPESVVEETRRVAEYSSNSHKADAAAYIAQTAARSAAKVAKANPKRNAKDPAKRRGDALTDEHIIALGTIYGHLESVATRLEAAKAETAVLVKSGHYAKGLGGAVRQRVTAAMTRVRASLALIDRACESDATAKAAAEKNGGEQ